MEQINRTEVERKRGYWQHVLSKIERSILKLQSERVDIQYKITHLTSLRKQAAN
ncbi:hypothetical protein JW851_03165 [Candidatus Woesearchaeota archaeon]|nr:hypothetical protein [Candidatus Woesearchaeota archaeon]